MERVDARIRYVWLTQVAVAAVVLGLLAGGALFVVRSPVLAAVGGLAIAAVGVAVGAWYVTRRYAAWRFELQDDALYLERGVFTEVRTVVPYVRVQHVDTQRNPVERALGLARVVVYTAGSRGADVTVPGLTTARAARLRGDLRTRTREREGGDGV